jgi:hypothetical protein
VFVEPPPLPTAAQTRERKAYTAWAHFLEGLDGWKDRSEKDRAARVKITVTRLLTKSAASDGRRSLRLSAQRYSIATFLPST